MPNWDSLAAYGRELAGLESDLTGSERQKITRQMGRVAQEIADRAAASDLGGDRAFSGWTRASPIALDTVVRNGRNGATILSPTRGSAGPWTVAERGRNQGDAGGFAGPGVNRSTGLTSFTKAGKVRKVRERRARRWNGTTRGHRTASEALKVMDDKLPKIADAAVSKVIRKRFDVT